MILLGRKYLLVLLLAGATFGSATAVCIARDCTCVIRQVDTVRFPFSLVSRVAVNATTGRLYVSVDDALEIAVFDTAQLDAQPLDAEPMARVPTLGYHGGLAVDDRANKVYVAQSFAQRVRVIDGATHAYHDIEIPGLVNAIGTIAVDPEHGRLYVARADNFDVAVFDAATEVLLATIGKGCCSSPAVYLALDRLTGMLFVVDMGSKPGRVTVYEGDGRQVAEIAVADGPNSIVFDPVTRRAYVASADSLVVSVIDVTPGSPTEFTTVDSIALRDSPTSVAVDPGTGRAYTVNSSLDTLSVVDLSIARHVLDLDIGFQPRSVALDPVTSRAYAALADGQLAVVQGCPAPRRAEAAARRSASAAAATSAAASTPPARPNATADALRREFVRCNRMFRIRTQCVAGPDVPEAPLAQATIEAAGARVLNGGSASQRCGVPPDYHEIDLAAAGFFYSVPVVERGANAPTVWTFHSTALTRAQQIVPAATISRVTTPPESPWQEALWYLSRRKTGLAPDAECEHLP